MTIYLKTKSGSAVHIKASPTYPRTLCGRPVSNMETTEAPSPGPGRRTPRLCDQCRWRHELPPSPRARS